MASFRDGGDGGSLPVDRPRVITLHLGTVLGPEWIDWFEGGDLVDRGDGTSHLTVEVRDQAMLYGFLIRVRDLGVPLLGLYPVPRSGGGAAGDRVPGGAEPPGTPGTTRPGGGP